MRNLFLFKTAKAFCNSFECLLKAINISRFFSSMSIPFNLKSIAPECEDFL